MVAVLDVPPEEDEEDDKFLKKGADLFKELLRVYPVAEFEDYFQRGQWKDDLMRTDLQLIEAHRFEAGAPDPPPLEKVKMPRLPKEASRAVAPAKPQGLSALMGIRGGLPAAAGRAGASAAGAAASPVAELRLVSLFVAKWKLDASKTKLALSKLPLERRRYVIQHFRAPADGEETIKGLEKYIAECEKTQAWGPLKAAPATGAAPAANGVHAPTPAGVKRPVSVAVPAPQEPNKQPKAAPAQGAAAFLLARARAQQQARPGGVVRPGLLVSGPRPAASKPPAAAQEGLRPGPVTPRPTIPRGALISGLLHKF